MILGAWIELLGGLFIAFGFLTRIAALIAAGEMAFAYFMVHAAGKALDHAPSAVEQFFPLLNKGELAVVYCWCFLFFLFYGPGQWSIDAMIRRGKAATRTEIAA